MFHMNLLRNSSGASVLSQGTNEERLSSILGRANFPLPTARCGLSAQFLNRNDINLKWTQKAKFACRPVCTQKVNHLKPAHLPQI